MKHKLLICIFSLFLFFTIMNLSFGLFCYELIEKEGYEIIYKIPLGNNSVQILGKLDKEKSNNKWCEVFENEICISNTRFVENKRSALYDYLADQKGAK